MADKKFTEDDLKTLINLSGNGYLRKSAGEKYNDFAKNDPFYDRIPDALLNSIDIIKYILTTGMIDLENQKYPFYPENLSGATYTCNFSGRYKYWDGEGKLKDSELKEGDVLILNSNSIVFLEIDTMFRVPEYLILRFNLKVEHVFKGLLLGMGPIVDPGFQGNLYIPLHNLTSNKYLIRKNAPLISVEFTKLSRCDQYIITSENLKNIVNKLDFSGISLVPKKITPKRKIDAYIEKALTSNEKFELQRSESEELRVISSIPNAINKAKNSAKEAKKDAEKAKKSAEKSAKTSRNYGIAGIIAAIFAFTGIIIAIFTIYNDISRIDTFYKKYEEMKLENQRIQKEYEERLNKTIDSISKELEYKLKTDSSFKKGK